MNRVGVMQITDTLALGGLERVAVNLANHLPREQFRSYLCVTRGTGPLRESVAPHVQRLDLNRTGRFDLGAVLRLQRFVAENDIRILHAHGTSLFIAAASVFLAAPARRPARVRHGHFGRSDVQERPAQLYRLATRTAEAVIAVNEPLAKWSVDKLRMPPGRVWYIRNFVATPRPEAAPAAPLPGRPGARIVCVANLRPQKDHLNLLKAMKVVAHHEPDAHLLLAGDAGDKAHLETVRQAICEWNLGTRVSWLGPRGDVPSLLKQCDIGVLSSVSEGLPLALIEYGMAGLAAVATRVGQCAEVLEDGAAGLLVPPQAPEALATALLTLLKSPRLRHELATRFSKRTREFFSPEAVIRQVSAVYDRVLSSRQLREAA